MKEYIRILIKFIKKNIIFIFLFILYICITYALNIVNCPIKLCIGYPCCGCGMTRACMAIFRLDFIAAFKYNPLVFILPFILFTIVFRERPFVSKVYKNNIFWIVIFILVLATYILRIIYVYPNIPMDYYEDNLLSKIIELFNK